MHLRESMMEALETVKSKGDEEEHENLQIRMRDREKMYEDYGCKSVE